VAAGECGVADQKNSPHTVHALNVQFTRTDYFDAITHGFGIRITPTGREDAVRHVARGRDAPAALDDRALSHAVAR